MRTAFCKYTMVAAICITAVSCNKVSIVGRWKQLEIESYDSIVGYKYERILTISADSTFIIDDGTEDDTASHIPGWYASGKFTGTWRMPDKKRLELRIDPKEPLMVLHYDIIKLTEKKLELVFPGWKTNPDEKALRYIRL